MKQTKILFSFGILLLAAISCTSDESISSDKICNGVSFDVAVVQLQEQQGEAFRAPAITNTPMKGKGTQMYVRQTTVGTIDQHMEPTLETKGTKVDGISSFKLYSYKYSESWASSYASATQVSDGVTLESSNNWKLTTPWANTNMAFFGIFDETNSASFSTDNGGELAYTVPSAVADQKDLLVAKNVDITEATNDSKVPMTFSHALTAVQFGIGSTMADGTITKIELQGIKNSGTYNFTNNTWTASGSAKYTIDNLNVDIASNKGSGSTKLFTGSNNDLLLLMPQTLGAEAKLVVYITEKGTQQTLSVSLAGGEWKAGHTVTYSLTTSSETGQYVFIVGDLDKSSVDENGGTVSSTIKSYYQDYYGTQTAIGWTATYSVDDGTETSTTGDIVTSFTANGTGNSNYSMTVEKSYPISDPSSNSHTYTLRNKDLQGAESNPINLAGSSETTANCYIVSAPGYYKIPLVYGNGLKNGANNSASLVGGTFVNHAGTPITTPYIKDYATPANAVIVWQDAYHLVHPSSLQISSDNKYLSFQVPQQYICQGNCVLAVRDASNTILWSWHIWVTDQNMATVSTDNGGITYYFMPVALGHCDSDTRNQLYHSIIVNISQKNSENKKKLHINQSAGNGIQSLDVSAPFYQWGKKDPSRPVLITNSWKQLYDNSEYPNVTMDGGYLVGQETLAEGIKTPYLHYHYDKADWCSTTHYNLWNVGNTVFGNDYLNTNLQVVKSIYDPCPVGFRIPEENAFSGFSKHEFAGNYYQLIDGNNWYCYGQYWQGVLNNVGTNGHYWSAGPVDNTRGYNLGYSTDYCGINTTYRSCSQTVRPVKEE